MTTQPEALAAIPGKHAQPAADTLAYLPKGGAQLAYLGHAEVTLALIEVDPLWTWEPLGIVDGVPVILKEQNRFVMWARLTVLGKTIVGVGTCETRKGDPEKELIGDFLRNAAMRFGIGTKLWSKATDADPAGRADVTSPTRTRSSAPAPDKPAGDITEAQKKRMHATFNDRGITDRSAKMQIVVNAVGRPVESSNELSKAEAAKVIDALEAMPPAAAA